MKKTITTTEKAITKMRTQKLTIGLDLGDRSSWYCVLDERGEIMLERKLSTTPKAIRDVFGGMPGEPDRSGGRDPFALDKPVVDGIRA